MRYLLTLLFINVFLGCTNGQKPLPKQETMQEQSDIVIFTEGTVGQLGGHNVMFSNIMLQDYTDAQGNPQEGLAASLSLPNQKEWITAGKGHTFELDGVRYTVLDISDEDPSGSVKVGLATPPPSTRFKGNTVGYLGERRIAFANVMPRDYTDGAGNLRNGLAASVSLPGYDDNLIVGEGSTFELDGTTYEVINVVAEDQNNDYDLIEVRPVP